MRPSDPRGFLTSLLATTLIAVGACGPAEDTIPPPAAAGASRGGTGAWSSGGRAGGAGQERGSAGNQAAQGGSGARASAGAGGREATGGSAGARRGSAGTGGGLHGAGGSHDAGSGSAGSHGDVGRDAGGAAGEAGLGAGGAAGGAVNEGGGAGAAGSEAGGEGGSQAEERQELVYISRLVGGVLTLSIDRESGAPSELTGSSPTDAGRHLYAMATEPARRFLYTADPDDGNLDAYRIGIDGTIAKTPDSSTTLDEKPITLAVGGSGPFLYAGTLDDSSVHIFALDADTGALDAAIPAFALEKEPAYLAVDPSGRFLYLSQELEAGIRGFAIAPSNGALTELEGSPFATTLVRSGALAFEPDGAFLFSAGGGLNAFSIDPTSGQLTAVDGSPFSLDVGSDFFASNLAVDPLGAFLYVTSFSNTRNVTGFAIDRVSGALAEVEGARVTTSSPYSVAIDPAGRFVFVGNDNGETSVFSLHRPDGKLKEVENSPFPLGGPQPEFAFASVLGRPAE